MLENTINFEIKMDLINQEQRLIKLIGGRKTIYDLRNTSKSGVYNFGINLLSVIYKKIKKIKILITDEMKNDMVQLGIDNKDIIVDSSYSVSVHFRIKDELQFNWTNYDLYFTPHYLYSPLIPIPCAFTIHDTIRLSSNKFCKKNENFDSLLMDYYLLEELLNQRKSADNSLYSYLTFATKRCLKNSEFVIYTSNELRKEIIDIFKVDSPFLIIKPTVNELFQRKSSNILRSQNKLLFVGQFKPHKGFEWLFNAINIFKSQKMKYEFILHLVGNYTEKTRTEITQLSIKHEVESMIKVHGPISKDELLNLYRTSSLLINSSFKEGYCLPIAEALSVGLNVICPNDSVLIETSRGCAHYFDLNVPSSFVRLLNKHFTNKLPNLAINY